MGEFPGGDRPFGVYYIQTPALADIQLGLKSVEHKAIARVTHPRPALRAFLHRPNRGPQYSTGMKNRVS
ncbi:hypothetical protein NG791_19580 [Laspinema sp. D1]|uniref:hypothetical protein n=1 Tax=Laspinema palackyanum TaxID=3231601 RepID=UPI00348803CF|nr:hypothetical protein [Laspinema sp. D2b]